VHDDPAVREWFYPALARRQRDDEDARREPPAGRTVRPLD
jgi:hypothetical protein